MAHGKQISADLCQAIMNLLQYYNCQDVAERTGVALSSVYMIASDMVKKGGIPPQNSVLKVNLEHSLNHRSR